MDIKVEITPWHNTGFLWLNNHLLVISNSKFKQFEAFTGSTVSEWPLPNTDEFLCIALPMHGEFITYSARLTVSLWDMLMHTQSSHLKHSQHIHSIALSPDDLLLKIGGKDRDVTINSLSSVMVHILSCWIVVHMTKFLVLIIFHLGFNPFVPSTIHIPGSTHSH